MTVLEVNNIHKRFGKTDVLKGIDFKIEEGEVVSVIGSSGSGKTTLLRCITGLESADEGRISVGGRVTFDSERKEKLSREEKRENQLCTGLVFSHLIFSAVYGSSQRNACQRAFGKRRV